MKRYKGMTLVEIIVSMAVYAMIALLLCRIMMTVNATIRNTTILNERFAAEGAYADNRIAVSLDTDKMLVDTNSSITSVSINVDGKKIDIEPGKGSTGYKIGTLNSEGKQVYHTKIAKLEYQDKYTDSEAHYKFVEFESVSKTSGPGNEYMSLEIILDEAVDETTISSLTNGGFDKITKLVVQSDSFVNAKTVTFSADQLNLTDPGASLLKPDEGKIPNLSMNRGDIGDGRKEVAEKTINFYFYASVDSDYQGKMKSNATTEAEKKIEMVETDDKGFITNACIISGVLKVFSHNVLESTSGETTSVVYDKAVVHANLLKKSPEGESRALEYDVDASTEGRQEVPIEKTE